MSREERKESRRKPSDAPPPGETRPSETSYTIRTAVPATITIEVVATEGTQPPTISPSPPPGGDIESPDGTTIPPAPHIVDAGGAWWEVTDGVIYRDGDKTISANVTLLLYYDKEVYQQNRAGGWWVWRDDGWVDSHDPRVEAPAPSPGPSPAPGPNPGPGQPEVELRLLPNNILQVGDPQAYFLLDNCWGTVGMTRGTYTGVNGNQWESYIGREEVQGANPSINARWAWKFPKGSNEVKAYLEIIFGGQPGMANEWICPGGYEIILPDGSISQKAPSGTTPGGFLPLPANGNLPPINCSFSFEHKERPTGKGQLVFDIWLQEVPQQIHGFPDAPLTHEIMIPVDNWGDPPYGSHPNGSNPNWYNHDVTLDGRLWHVYRADNFGNIGGNQWMFVVFKPDQSNVPINPVDFNLSTFINYVKTKGWASGNEHLISIEMGIEVEEATGDIQVNNYKVTK